jgi:hypothetical protein
MGVMREFVIKVIWQIGLDKIRTVAIGLINTLFDTFLLSKWRHFEVETPSNN